MGSAGRQALKAVLPSLKAKYNPTFIVANGENAAGGKGITAAIAKEMFDQGIHAITLGNHAWDNKEVFEFIDDEPRLIRPLNFPEGTPGRGTTTVKAPGGRELIVVNVQGRAFLPPLDCPFRTMDRLLEGLPKNKPIFVDFHAEATSEKIALGWHLDGRVAAVVGTHTHVQTHDEQILPKGTAYVTDVGMVGSREGVLGMERTAVIKKFITSLPVRFVADEGKWQFHATLLEVDEASGKATSIRLIRQYEGEFVME